VLSQVLVARANERPTVAARRRARAFPPPPRKLAIIAQLPAYRRGLAVALTEHAFEIDEHAAVDDALAHVDAAVLVLQVESDWDALARLQAAHTGAIIALLVEATTSRYQRALRLGVTGVVAHDAAVDDIVATVEAALAGLTLLPAGVVQCLVARGGATDEVPISKTEIGWLRAMADGATVAKLAVAARYSERQMHRRIAALYKRIGAANRQQALLFAARCGMLD
jgi:DNA-binding NarL/FixJ family response regulator